MPGKPTAPSTLSGHAADIWQSAFASAYDGTCKERSDRDACAASIAWSAVKNVYKKNESGEWVEKAADPVVGTAPSTGDIPAEFPTPMEGSYGFEMGQVYQEAYHAALQGVCATAPDPEGCAREKAMWAVEEANQTGNAGTKMEQKLEVDNSGMSGSRIERGKKPMMNYDPHAIAVRRLEREVEAKHDAEMLAAGKGDASALRPAQMPSDVWRSLPPELRTVKAMLNVRAYERGYQEAADTALEEGWERFPNSTLPEEFIFRRFVDTPDGAILVRAVLVRPAKGGDWYLRELSRGAASSLAARSAPGEVRYRPFVQGSALDDISILRGGPGSGHHGHKGRPGERGGSAPGDGQRITKPENVIEVPAARPMGDQAAGIDTWAAKAIGEIYNAEYAEKYRNSGPEIFEFAKDEAVGIKISQATGWDGHDIMRAYAHALEEANDHEKAKVVRDWIVSEEGKVEAPSTKFKGDADPFLAHYAVQQFGPDVTREQFNKAMGNLVGANFAYRSPGTKDKPFGNVTGHIYTSFRAALEDANWHDRANTVQGWMEESGTYNPYGPPTKRGPQGSPTIMESTAAHVTRGGPGSGHYGHAGRPGQVGGSEPSYGEGDRPSDLHRKWRQGKRTPTTVDSARWDDLYFIAHGALASGKLDRASEAMQGMNAILSRSTDPESRAGLEQELKKLAEEYNLVGQGPVDAEAIATGGTNPYAPEQEAPEGSILEEGETIEGPDDWSPAEPAADYHSGIGKRGHLLLTKELEKQLPPLYTNEQKGKDAQALVKFFSPLSNWTWYASEYDPESRTFFGLVDGFEKEFGYFSLDELEGVEGPAGMPAVERDMDWEPKTFRELLAMGDMTSPAEQMPGGKDPIAEAEREAEERFDTRFENLPEQGGPDFHEAPKSRGEFETPDALADHLISEYSQPTTMKGRPIAGDIFYDDISRRVKAMYPNNENARTEAFMRVVDRLKAANYWVHS